MSKLAVLGGEPIRTLPWPDWPGCRDEDIEAVERVLRSGKWWSYAGEETSSFEQAFAHYHDTDYGICVNSGTSALHLGLRALGIGPGDEVIVPAYTFLASATSVLLSNAVPIFADVDPVTLNLSAASVRTVMTSRTRAVMPVHLAGLPVDMDALGDVISGREIVILEDCAQAHGAIWRGRKVGSIGNASAFSFQASKNLTCGEGGIIATNDPQLAARAGSFRDCGRAQGQPFYEHHLLGHNMRITEMQSALLRSRLRRLEEETVTRWRNGRRLTEALADIPGLLPLDPTPGPGDRRAYHLYPVRVISDEFDGVTRDQFARALQSEGVPAGHGYGTPLYRNPVFTEKNFFPHGCPVSCSFYTGKLDYQDVRLPVVEQLCQEVLWLPHHVLLGTDEDTADIIRAFVKVAEEYSALVVQ